MKKLLYLTMIICYLIGFSMLAFSQGYNAKQPEIGERLPEFELKNIQQFNRKAISNETQLGRHYILDFFSSGCTSCVKAFPKTNNLYALFKDKLDIILVGKEDKYIRTMYEKYRKKQQLQLPIVFDSALCNRWVPQGYPFLLWIDNNGVVKAATTSQQLTEDNIRSFIAGNSFNFRDISSKAYLESVNNNNTNTLQSFNTGDNNVLSASILSLWDGKTQQSAPSEFSENIREFESQCMLLQWLYNIAYWGKSSFSPGDSLYNLVARFPQLELTDASKFEFDFEIIKGLYNYTQVVPDGKSIEYKQQILRNDLEKAFGYKVDIETRVQPVWKLVAKDGAYELLKTKGGNSSIESIVPHAEFSAKNISPMQLVRLIWSYHQREPPFVEETGFIGNMDLNIKCIISDLEDVRKMLLKHKLDLVKSEKEYKVLVIRDP